MKREKLKIDSIKITSFITKLDNVDGNTIQGAENNGSGWYCSWYLSGCVLSLECPTAQAETACWTKAPIAGICPTGLQISKIDPGLCPKSVPGVNCPANK
jgi:hypothetical protein